MAGRRFPPPWAVDETDACFIVKDRTAAGRRVKCPSLERRRFPQKLTAAVESENANKINYRGCHGARAGFRPLSKPLAEQGQEELD
jgi:hypothetical protein